MENHDGETLAFYDRLFPLPWWNHGSLILAAAFPLPLPCSSISQKRKHKAFIHGCGRLNRDERDYKLWTDSGESLQKNDQQYRPWFRASLTAI